MKSAPRDVDIPHDARDFLSWALTSRPLAGEPPAIDLVVGYRKSHASPNLALFLSSFGQP
jgi:LysR family transcriptional regulator, hca operon transcriptional activator